MIQKVSRWARSKIVEIGLTNGDQNFRRVGYLAAHSTKKPDHFFYSSRTRHREFNDLIRHVSAGHERSFSPVLNLLKLSKAELKAGA